MTATTVVSGPARRRRRWSAADKLRIAEESLASGLSVAEFARQRDIAPSLIHGWRRQARSRERSSSAAEVQFAPVVVTTRSGVAVAPISDPGDGLMVEVVLRNGRLLRLSERMVPARAALLADAMEGCAR
jgi:transposase